MANRKNPNEGMTGPCEAGVGLDHQDGFDRMPVITKCHKPGTWRAAGLMPYGTILCDNCYDKIEAREKARALKEEKE